MGIKGLQLQKPAVPVVVQVQEFQALVEGHVLALAGGIGHQTAVCEILPDPIVLSRAADICILRDAVKAHQRRPGIPLLAPDAVPGGVALVVRRAAVLPVVIVDR